MIKMANKKPLLLLSLAIQVLVLFLLATGSGLLLEPFFGTSLPWGNFLTWLLLTLFPLNFLVIRRSTRVHSVPLRVFYALVYLGLILGFFWPFVSRILTGNWAASFNGQDTKRQIWDYYTYAAALAPFAGYFLMRLLMVFFKTAEPRSDK